MEASQADNTPPRLRFHLFGPFEVWLYDHPLPRLRSRKSQWLLALLALRQGAEVERDWVAGLLWPERLDRQALRNSLTELRHALGPAAVRLRSPTSHTLSLDRSGAVVDVRAFDAAIARGDPGTLAEAVSLYRGPLLEGCAEAWVYPEREAREQAYLTTLETLAGHALAGGDLATAEGHLRRAAVVDPLRENVQRALMEVLAASGNYARALLCYRELRLRLHRELNTEPDPETRALFEQLRIEARRVQKRSAIRTLLPSPSPVAAPRPDSGSSCAAPPMVTDHRLVNPPTGAVGSSMGAENRLVTVLFAGMGRPVVATQSLHAEEAAALVSRLLAVMVDAIHKFGGQVDRFLGDGLLAIFGMSQAHEDDPERAIRAALEIQAAAGRLAMEVTAGINTGEVYLGAIGSARHQEVSVAGPVVNLAAWLQRQAEPGQTLVGRGTYDQTRRAFGFSPLSLEIKGLAEPVTAYAVAQALARPEKSRGIEGLRAELIGREEELARLEAAVAAVAQGDGQMVSLIGEAGIGKSRLVAELRQGVGCRMKGVGEETPDPTPFTLPPTPLWLEGRCHEMSAAAGYSVFVDLFRDYFAWRPEEDDRARGDRLAASLRELQSRGRLAAERVEEMGPLLGNLLFARFDTDWDERLLSADPEQIQYQTFLAVRDFLVALSNGQPLLLVFEDLHWVDSLSLDLLSLLMESVPLARIGLLCVYRPEQEHRSSHLAALAGQQCPERFTEIRLRELTPEQSGRLVESLLPMERLPGPIKAQILQKPRGNPFFLEELVRSLIDSGLVYREGEEWKAREGAETLSVPDSVQGLISSRFDRLRPELKPLLESAAVFGRVFRPRLLERMGVSGGRSTWDLEPALGELEELGLVYQERAVPEVEYSFKHVLMQETIYQRLLRGQRARLHQRAAEAIEAIYPDRLPEQYEELAYHYDLSAAEEKAVEYLLKAGEKARRAYLNEDAIRSFRRALERLDRPAASGTSQRDERSGTAEGMTGLPSAAAIHDPRLARARLEALRALGQTYQTIGKHAEAEEQFRQAIALGEAMGLEPRELAWLYFWLGDTLAWEARAEEMIGPAEEMLARLGEPAESVEAALMNYLAGTGYQWRGDRERGLEYLRRNARLLPHLPYSEELRMPYYSILNMVLFEENNIDEAMRWTHILEQNARQHYDLRALASALEFRSGILYHSGDFRGVIPALQQALEPYVKIGSLQSQFLGCLRLRETFLLLGNLPDAETAARQERAATEAMGNAREIAWAMVDVGIVSLCQGDWESAWDAFQQARQTGSSYQRQRSRADYALGRAALARGNRAEAQKQFLAATHNDDPEPMFLINVLCGLEEASNDPGAFRDFCQRYRAEHSQPEDSPFVHWYLEPAQPDCRLRIADCGLPTDPDQVRNPQSAIRNQEWVWHDPFGDCSFTIDGGLEIRAACGRDFWHPNRSAPRLLRPVSGDFTIQAVCRPVSAAAPAMGGLLLWRNEQHYLRLDWGTKGPHQLTLGGCLPGKQFPALVRWGRKGVILGRGRLPGERIFMRLERRGGWVRALCSAEGRRWFSLGQVEFPADAPVAVGPHAIGRIDPLIYPGAYPEGTAIRFESFELWA